MGDYFFIISLMTKAVKTTCTIVITISVCTIITPPFKERNMGAEQSPPSLYLS